MKRSRRWSSVDLVALAVAVGSLTPVLAAARADETPKPAVLTPATAPLAPEAIRTYGGTDADVVLPDAASPKVTQSGTSVWAHGSTIVVHDNDSRTSSSCYSGVSTSTDGGATWVAAQPLCTGHGTTYGYPGVAYDVKYATWFATALATGCGGGGIGGWTSANGITWAPGACVHSGSSDDRHSLWVDNASTSPFYGNMYVYYNDYNVSGGAPLVTRSTDGGATWGTPATLNPGFLRAVNVTGSQNGDGTVIAAAMDEGGGGLSNRTNKFYRSTDGGVTWALTYTSPAFYPPGRSVSGYFAGMYSSPAGYWRYMGAGQPGIGPSNVVHYAYTMGISGTDPGNVMYIRSTDNGVTWSAPLQLNTDATTRAQWEPSLAVTKTGGVLVSWYDERETVACGSPGASTPCYRRWGRASLDGGVTWQPDQPIGDAVSPLPAQPDPAVNATFVGDWDYANADGETIFTAWVDGSTLIGGASQQDVVFDKVTLSPTYGGTDADVVLPDAASPKVTQSGTSVWAHGDTIVVHDNDSRTSASCYSGVSTSTDGGATWAAAQPLCSGHGTTYGYPGVAYDVKHATWFATALASGCGGDGIGGWTSANGVTWAPGACVHTGSGDDRHSLWVDNASTSPFYGYMYVYYNDFNVSGGAPLVTRSTDGGATWGTPVILNAGFLRAVNVTGSQNGDGTVVAAAMDEGGGGLANRVNRFYRSTDGGSTWALTYTSPAFYPPGRAVSGYFAGMYASPAGYWRYMGAGQPGIGPSNVVHYAYTMGISGVDPGNVMYIRSTDNGVTWSAPLQLNTDATTRAQWEPSLAVTKTGAVLVSWYDERDTAACGSPGASTPCYRRWGRTSLDGGVTWQPDQPISDALSPLPAQPDTSIQSTFAGDWDYAATDGETAFTAWVDGRVLIGGASQQDVFFDKVVLRSPTAASVGGGGTICAGQSAAIHASLTGTSPWNVTWSDGVVQTGVVASLATRSVSPSSTTTYTVTAVSDLYYPSGSSTGSAPVTVNPIPSTPAAGSNSPVCVGATLSLFTSTVAGASYSWTGPNGFTSATQNPSITGVAVAAAGAYHINVTVAGCTSAAGTANVVVNADTAAPTVTAPAPVTVYQTACCGTFGGATAAASTALHDFLAAGSATDDCDPSPARLAPQVGGVDVTSSTCFGAGTTLVTFRYQDASAHVGSAASNAIVRMFGDLNLDATIDPSDMVVMRAYFNFVVSPGTPPFNAPLGAADLNHDSTVDPSDLVILRAYFNFVVGCLAP